MPKEGYWSTMFRKAGYHLYEYFPVLKWDWAHMYMRVRNLPDRNQSFHYHDFWF